MYLQYVNIFFWNGTTENYNSRALLDATSSCVPASILDHGPNWHLHQGWFSQPTESPGRRILDRMHIDAIDDTAGRHIVKFENLHRFDFEPHALRLQDALSEHALDTSFDILHARAKKTVGEYLTADVQRSINLHAT